MRIALGCDHRGFTYKEAIATLISEAGHTYEDFGCYDTSSVDYPDFARDVAMAVAEGESDFGILICSSGIGMSIAANKVKGIRAALCHNPYTANRSRLHNDANVLCLGSDIIGQGLAEETVRVFLETEFEGGRHARRLDKIRVLEN